MSKKFLAVATAALLITTVLITTLAASFAFAQAEPPDRVRVLRSSNLRAGPGTGFAIVGAAGPGSEFDVQGCNAACTWYQVGTEQWIAAFLVEPVTETRVTATPTVTGTANSGTAAAVTGVPSGTAPALPPDSIPAGSVRSTATSNSNLREGPGTDFPVVGRASAGEVLEIVGRNEAGTWLALSSGGWIAAFLVDNAPPLDDLPVLDETGTSSPTPRAASTPLQATSTTTPTLTPTATSSVCDWDSYPTVCIFYPPPDLSCADVFHRNFEVRPPDPHNFDEDGNGIGCEDSSVASPTRVPPTPTRSPTRSSGSPTVEPSPTGSSTPRTTGSQLTTTPAATAQPRTQETPSPGLTQTPLAATSAGCDCSADLYQCADFDTQAEAQACYDQCVAEGQGDIHRINIDNDAMACESLP